MAAMRTRKSGRSLEPTEVGESRNDSSAGVGPHPNPIRLTDPIGIVVEAVPRFSVPWRRRRGRLVFGLRIDPLTLVVTQPAEACRLEPVLDQDGRGTRGPSAAVSSREDGFVLG